MPSESHPKITRNLFWISFALWFVALVTPGWAVFEMDIAVYNATYDLIAYKVEMSIFYFKYSDVEYSDYGFYGTYMRDIFFKVFMLEMIANSILATVASAICCIVSIYNSRNPTQVKTATVALLFMFAEIMESIVVLKIIFPTAAYSPTLNFNVPYSALLAVLGILVGLSGWILNGFHFLNLRNQVSSSSLARQSVVFSDCPSSSQSSIQSSPSYCYSSLHGSKSEILSEDGVSAKSYSEGYIPYYRTDSILCL